MRKNNAHYLQQPTKIKQDHQKRVISKTPDPERKKKGSKMKTFPS